jgi:type IV pilus assembly protein PilQ
MRAIYIVLIFSLCIGHFTYAQENNIERLKKIESQLSSLSEELVPGLNLSTNFSVVDVPIQELLRGVAETHNLNISIDPKINVRVTNNFTNVIVRDLLIFLCKEYSLDIRFVGTIMSFFSYALPLPKLEPAKPKEIKILYDKETDKLSLDLTHDSLSVFVKKLTSVSDKNVIISPLVGEKLLNGFIKETPFDQALDKIAFANNLELKKTKDGFYILEPSNKGELTPKANAGGLRSKGGQNQQPEEFTLDILYTKKDTLLTLDAVNTPIIDLIKAASIQMGKNYVFFSDPPGNTTSKIKNITYDQFLTYILQANTHTYKKQQNIYLIGDRTQEGFRSTHLVKLQFRTVQDIEKSIPAEITKGVDIKVFKELNSLILSGGTPQIMEIIDFIHALDQPVPNILIEVIVANAKKGVNLRTGVKAGFGGDSIPPNAGNIFPGVDVTLSSRNINDLLGRLGATGLINLGRVTPRFYATLEAMEENSLIEIRSTPKLATLNGHEANLSIGQSEYYLEQTQNITGGVTPINSVSQRWNKVEAALSIKIHPIVSGDEHITLNIDAEFSNFIPPRAPMAPPGNDTRKFISQIRVRNEEMIVLGGLEETTKSKTRSGFPLLSRIPVLSFLFSSRITDNTESHLIIFIKPTIVN